MAQDRPTKTTSIADTITGYVGNPNLEKKNSELNPPKHGFNKASRKQDPRTWGGADGHYSKGDK